MVKYILLISLLLSAVMLSALVEETASFKDFMYGQAPTCQYDNWISHLAEKITSVGYNVYAPWDRQTTGFGGFHIPTSAELTTWGDIIDAFLAQQWELADSRLLASGFPYQVVQFHDTDTGRTYFILREIPNTDVDGNGTLSPYDDEIGAFAWGWGIYVFNPESTRRAIVNIPHPCDDFIAPVLATTAFEKWNAEFMMVAGAGREVAWTNVAPYTNSKSLSDPTRTTNHPFYPAYTKFCNKIRTDTGFREWSAQLHSYDTNLHLNFSSVQISAGYNRGNPNLPIRDLSRFKNDLINQSQYLMIPHNTIGSNSDVFVNDYYTVQYDTYPFTYDNDGTAVTVNNYMDLPAYSQNVLMNYTLQNMTDYDVYEPFFHAEMDELPNCYVQSDNNYKWFYGWNTTTQSWDMHNIFQHSLEYYSIWINNMDAVLDATLLLNDGFSPRPPSNLTVFNQSYDYITLQWNKSDDFDFDTYEIQYATQPITGTNYQTYNRNNDSSLASPYTVQCNLNGLANNTQYYFRIRAKDKNGNASGLSAEASGFTSPARITTFVAVGKDGYNAVRWGVNQQANNQGFKIYRSDNDFSFILQDSYLTNPALAGGFGAYNWQDYNVENGRGYTYKISSISTSDVEFYHNIVTKGYPRDYFTLYVSREDNALVDSLSFSANPNASAGNDGDYDIVKSAIPTLNYVFGGFWEQYWGNNGTYLQQEVMGDFDLAQETRTWSIRVKSDQINVPLTFRVDPSYTRYSEKLYLRDGSNGIMTDLASGPYTFQVADANIKNFTLYWGNLQPSITISNLPNRVFQGGTSQAFYWNTTNNFLIDHYNVSIKNDADSILVAQNLINTTSNYTFVFPSDIDLQNCRLYVDAWAQDGQLTQQVSGFQFGIVSSSNTYAIDPGLSMQANIWPSSGVSIPQVFGEGSVGWTMDSEGAWWEISPFVYGLGYWIDKSNPFDYNSSLTTLRDSTSFQLRPGWNILPNPHLCSYQVKDLRFRLNGTSYSFAELQDQQLVSRGIYVYRNGHYELTDMIYPQESYLLKFYGTASMSAFVVYIPYNSGANILPVNPDWALKLTATQQDSDTDELFIGSYGASTDGYEFNFDLPEPPQKPLDGLTRLFIYRDNADSLYLDRQLNTDFRSALSTSAQEEKVWNFCLNAGNTNPVEFTVDPSLFPAGYGASINIGSLAYDIQHGNTFFYTPTQAGPNFGQIVIHNYFTGNEDNVAVAFKGLTSYPNPFNPSTTIAFSLSKSLPVDVTIYNIKGQVVKTLHSGVLKSGNQKLIWDGRNSNNISVGSGIYFAKVATAKSSKLLKLMLLK